MTTVEEILQAIETLTDNKCMTLSEALEKAYLAGHRTAVSRMNGQETSNAIASTGIDTQSK